MAGPRQRSSRSRSSRHHPSSQPPDVETAVRHLLDLLSPHGDPTPHYAPLCQSLTNFLRSPNLTSQLHVAHHLPLLLRRPTFPTLRLRLARLFYSLSHWLSADVDHALTTLATLTTDLLSAATYEPSAITATLNAVIFSVKSVTHPSPTSDIVARHIPTFIPLLHTALFKAPNASTEIVAWTSPSSATSDGTVSSTHARTSVRTPCIRLTVILTIHALVRAAPTSSLPLWPLLLPTRPGVTASASPSRRNLATILLYDPDPNNRSAVAALIATLVTAARPLLTRVPPRHAVTATTTSSFSSSTSATTPTISTVSNSLTSASSGVAFMPASQRAAVIIAALHPPLVTALRGERAPTVIPRLARLASDIALTARPPIIPAGEHAALLQALGHTALRQAPQTDLTSRAAAASALATALAALGGPRFEAKSLLTDVASRVVDVIIDDPEQQGLVQHLDGQHSDTFPVAELLTVLRSIITIDHALFIPLWRRCAPFCANVMVSAEVGKRDVALHTARLVDAFATACTKRKESDDEADVIGEAQYFIESTGVACDMYHSVLHSGIEHSFHAVQTTTAMGMDALLQALGRVAPPESASIEENAELQNDVQSSMTMARETMLKIVDVLMRTASDLGLSTGLRAAAVKALGSVQVDVLEEDLLCSVLVMLHRVVCESGGVEHVTIRARGLSAFASIANRVLDGGLTSVNPLSFWDDDPSVGVLPSMAEHCQRLLLKSGGQSEVDGMSASVRANVESSRVGAVNCLAIVVLITLKAGVERSIVEKLRSMVDGILRTLNILLTDGDVSVIVRCAACKAIGRISRMSGCDERILIGERQRGLLEVLAAVVGQKSCARVEAEAVRSLSDVIADNCCQNLDELALFRRCGRSLQWCEQQTSLLEMTSTSRGQYLHLQAHVGELVCKLLLSTEDRIFFREDEDVEGVPERLYVEAVCRHYKVPSYQMEAIMHGYRKGEYAVDNVLEHLYAGGVQDVFSEEVEEVLRRLFGQMFEVDIIGDGATQ